MRSLLVPPERTVAHLCEAAARFRSDLMVAYQASCRTYVKSRLFSANTSKSFCNVEAVLLDIRTGIVPFTSSASREFQVDESDSDFNVYETRQKAELSAISGALSEIAEDIQVFMAGVTN